MVLNFIIGASALLGAAGTIASAQAQRQQARMQQRQQQEQFRRSQREALRQAQIQRAGIRATGAAAGALGGSAVAGAMGSVSSQLGTELGYATMQSGISNRITQLGTRASTMGALASLGFTGANFAAGFRQPTAASQPNTIDLPTPRSIYEQ